MEIEKTAKAGTLESNDILIMVAPNDTGVRLELDSIVMKQFGEIIESTIREKLKEMGAENIFVKAQDKGALCYTIQARIEADDEAPSCNRKLCRRRDYSLHCRNAGETIV